MSSNTHRHRELLLVLLALCAKRPVGHSDLASETVRRLAGPPSAHALEPLGALTLKGLSDPVSATALRPVAGASTARDSLSNGQQWRGHSKRSAAEKIGLAVA